MYRNVALEDAVHNTGLRIYHVSFIIHSLLMETGENVSSYLRCMWNLFLGLGAYDKHCSFKNDGSLLVLSKHFHKH